MVAPSHDEEAELEASKAPLLEHLVELRNRIIHSMIAFFLAFLVFTLRIIRRGPSGLPAHALPSGSLKRGLRPEIAGVQPYLAGGE